MTPALQRKHTPGEAFLRALWGDEPRGFIALWTLADRTSTCLTEGSFHVVL
jgi:hypothetical protein